MERNEVTILSTTKWSFRNRKPSQAHDLNTNIKSTFGKIVSINLLMEALVEIDRQANEFLKHSPTHTFTAKQQRFLITQFEKIPLHSNLPLFVAEHEGIFTFYDNVIAEYLLQNNHLLSIRFFLDYFNASRFSAHIKSTENNNSMVIPAHLLDFINPRSTLIRFLSTYPALTRMLLSNSVFISEMIMWDISSKEECADLYPFQIYLTFLSLHINQQEIKDFLSNDMILVSYINESLESIPDDIREEVFKRLKPLIAFLSELDTAENSPKEGSSSPQP